MSSIVSDKESQIVKNLHGFIFLDDTDRSPHQHGKQDHWDLSDIIPYIVSGRMKPSELASKDTLYPRSYRVIGYTNRKDIHKAVICMKRADDTKSEFKEKEQLNIECQLIEHENGISLFHFYLSMRNWHSGRFLFKIYLVTKDNKEELGLVHTKVTMPSKAKNDTPILSHIRMPEWILSSLHSAFEKQLTSPETSPKKQSRSPPSSPCAKNKKRKTSQQQLKYDTKTEINPQPQHNTQVEVPAEDTTNARWNTITMPDGTFWDPLTYQFGDLPCMEVSETCMCLPVDQTFCSVYEETD